RPDGRLGRPHRGPRRSVIDHIRAAAGMVLPVLLSIAEVLSGTILGAGWGRAAPAGRDPLALCAAAHRPAPRTAAEATTVRDVRRSLGRGCAGGIDLPRQRADAAGHSKRPSGIIPGAGGSRPCG